MLVALNFALTGILRMGGHGLLCLRATWSIEWGAVWWYRLNSQCRWRIIGEAVGVLVEPRSDPVDIGCSFSSARMTGGAEGGV